MHITAEEALEDISSILADHGVVKVSSNTQHEAEVRRDAEFKELKQLQKAALPEAASVMNLLTPCASLY